LPQVPKTIGGFVGAPVDRDWPALRTVHFNLLVVRTTTYNSS